MFVNSIMKSIILIDGGNTFQQAFDFIGSMSEAKNVVGVGEQLHFLHTNVDEILWKGLHIEH